MDVKPAPDDDRRARLDAFRRYLASGQTPRGTSTLPGADALRRYLSPSARMRAKQLASNLVAPVSRRKARAAAGASPLRLHLGCGPHHLDGWVNIDLVGAGADIVWDVRHELPFPSASVDVVFLEHVLEHLSYADALVTLQHAHRVLAPGGIIRIGVPDAGRYARQYAEEPAGLLASFTGRPTALCALREVFQEHGHISAWDGETLSLMTGVAGFTAAAIMPAGVSRVSPVPDLPSRAAESVYVEALRPR